MDHSMKSTELSSEASPAESSKSFYRSSIQLKGCLKRIYIERTRNIRITCCEFFFHFLILICLVFGYLLSDVTTFSEKKYSSIRINLPPNEVNEDNGITASGLLSLYNDYIQGPIMIPNLEVYILAQNAIERRSLDEDVDNILSQTEVGRAFTNLLYDGTFHFVPNNQKTQSLIRYFEDNYNRFGGWNTVTYYIHENEDEAIQYILNHLEEATFALIILKDITEEKVNYVIRQNYTTLPNTNRIRFRNGLGLNPEYQEYLTSGFLSLQQAIDDWVFDYTGAIYNNNMNTNDDTSEECTGTPRVVLTPYPRFAYTNNEFYRSVGFLLGLAMVMATMYPLSRLVKSMVEEKELRMKEVMKIMGLYDSIHSLSWFITAFILFLWIAITFTFLSSISFLSHSNPLILFLFFFFFCISEITFGFFLNVFFLNSKLAAIISPIALFAMLLPRYIFLNTNDNEQVASKIFVSILSPSAFAFGADILAEYENGGIGIQWSNLTNGDFNFGTILSMLLVDFLIYAILAWYLEQIIPHEYGVSKPFWFFLNFYYWFPRQNKNIVMKHEVEHMPEFYDSSCEEGTWDPNYEAIPSYLHKDAVVRMKNLKKCYANGKVAVNHMSLSMLKNQITCLLGHNGAGKTTTISMLTGLIDTTDGHASIFGYHLKDDLTAIRQITGICPQHNVLYPMLTVTEHLEFFGSIKGMTGRSLTIAIDNVINEVGLTEKKHVLSSALSGGMKRKLSLAIALIGNPLFLLLDEPTSGMDPYSRRATWELLQKCKKGKVVLLTTHFMEEADTLADRIAIMSEGRVRCSGSSLFLKTRFGAGYLLSISKLNSSMNVSKLHSAVQEFIPTAVLSSSVAGEVVFQLPIDTVASFPPLLTTLRDNSKEFCIGSYGISLTTLEQVFITLATTSRQSDEGDDSNDASEASSEIKQSICGRLMNILRCRMYSSIRNSSRRGGGGEYVLPSKSQTMLPRAEVQLGPITVDNEQKKNVDAVEGSGTAVVGWDYTAKNNSSKYDSLLKARCVSTNGTYLGLENESKPAVSLHHVSNGLAHGTVFIQTYELFRKRFIIASRDWKGFFFQIVLPVLLIVFILLILTVQVSPAGNTIILNGDLFQDKGSFTPYTHIAGDPSSSVYTPPLLSMKKLNRLNSDAATSDDLSDELLDPREYRDERYGAFVYDDLIQVRVKINWDWLADNFVDIVTLLEEAGIDFNVDVSAESVDDFFDALPDDVQEALNGVGITSDSIADFLEDLTADDDSNQLDLLDFTISILDGSINFGNFTLNLTATTVTDEDVEDFFDVFGVDISDDSIIANVTDLLNSGEELTDFLSEQLGDEFDVNDVADLLNTFNITSDDVESFAESIGLGPISEILVDFVDILRDDGFNGTVGVRTYELEIPSRYTVMHNSTSPHGIAAFQGHLIETAFKACTPASNGASSQYLIKNHPLPITEEEAIEIRVILSLLVSLFMLIPLCYVPASFIPFLVKERVSKSKHLQLVSGVSPFLYWTAAYIWDCLLFGILVALTVSALAGFGRASRVFIRSPNTALCFTVLLLVYGLSVLPLSYLYSMMFTNFSTAQITIMAINFMSGFVLVLLYFVLVNVDATKEIGEQGVHLFRFFPSYNVGEGLINLSAMYYSIEILNEDLSPWDWDVCGRNIIFMLLEAIGFFTAVLLTESRTLRKLFSIIQRQRALHVKPAPPPKSAPDEDVIQETILVEELLSRVSIKNKIDADGYTWRQWFRSLLGSSQSANNSVAPAEGIEDEYDAHVCDVADFEEAGEVQRENFLSCDGYADEYALIINHLKKTYPPSILGGAPKHAVRDISLACPKGERFGLLGINGAGKTTTLGVLTGDLYPTTGEVFIGGCPLSDSRTMRMIGYCPQVDPLLELMNAYETLWFFGRIRGISTNVLRTRVAALIKDVGLSKFADKPCGTYSGGNKRKLSLAVALVGDPSVLLLDEPSTGMDPEARRQMWTVIEKVSTNRSVVLVSHSMEEVEALCTRMGVMVSGRMQCLGSTQHLKSRFGGGYQIELRCNRSRIDDCIAFCQQLSPQAVVEEVHGGYVRLEVDRYALDLAVMFEGLEREKQNMEIYEYNVSQSSLEQVFLRFAAAQEEETNNNWQRTRSDGVVPASSQLLSMSTMG